MTIKYSYHETSNSKDPPVNMDVEASLHESIVPITFPFRRLPMELQLLMLQYFLVSPIPILNAGIPLDRQKYIAKGEQNGQDHLCPNIIFTCKLYHAEGLPLLYGRNTFMYTEPWSAFSHLMRKCDVKACHRRAKLNLPPPKSTTEQKPPRDTDFALANHAANLHLRLACYQVQLLVENCVVPLLALSLFLNLKSLHVDALDFRQGFTLGERYDKDWDDRATWMKRLAMNIERIPAIFKDPREPQRSLKEISFTGLPRNDCGLFIVKQYARLLAPNGRIGVGWGVKGKRYELLGAYEENGVSKREDSEVSGCKDVEVLWMRGEEVGGWIAREHKSGSKWLFN